MEFHKDKCGVPSLGTQHPLHQDKWGLPEWKQPAGLVDTTLKSHFKEEMAISTQSCYGEVTFKK